jgi:hypothetical protein
MAELGAPGKGGAAKAIIAMPPTSTSTMPSTRSTLS